jgi:hypothetical protein
VNNVHITSSILVDTSGISLEGIWNSNSTSNRAALIDLLHHGLFTLDRSKLVYLIDTILVGDEAWATAGLAILANVNRGTDNAIVQSSRLVNRASLISDVVIVHVLKSTQCLSTVASGIVSRA